MKIWNWTRTSCKKKTRRKKCKEVNYLFVIKSINSICGPLFILYMCLCIQLLFELILWYSTLLRCHYSSSLPLSLSPFFYFFVLPSHGSQILFFSLQIVFFLVKKNQPTKLVKFFDLFINSFKFCRFAVAMQTHTDIATAHSNVFYGLCSFSCSVIRTRYVPCIMLLTMQVHEIEIFINNININWYRIW